MFPFYESSYLSNVTGFGKVGEWEVNRAHGIMMRAESYLSFLIEGKADGFSKEEKIFHT